MKYLFWLVAISLSVRAVALPKKFDLRNVDGKDFVSEVKNQNGGTCWTHGTMAALESNLMVTGVWNASGESGDPNLAEYHLDWWNGFNQYYNADISPKKGGLTVHQGGDYRVAAAYLSRGAGPFRDVDAQSYNSAPKENDPSFRKFYVRHIEWMQAGKNLETIERIKQALVDHGTMGTALAWSDSLYSSSKNSFYQSPSSSSLANHAVAIVGWDDTKSTQASKPGAWLIKNSWGSGWGASGYFWISYYDKVAGQDIDMGAVSFQDVEPMKYANVYFHDYHGWRDTKKDSNEGFNAFVAKGTPAQRETLSAVSFYTVAPNTEYEVRVYATYQDGDLQDLLSMTDGIFENAGFHTVDLRWPVSLDVGQKFYVSVKFSGGGLAYDKTSNVPLLLGGSDTRVMVDSKASPGESFFRSANGWVDLTTFNNTANLCIKALTTTD